ncbi:hypothetical protein TorRG33x02_081940 [Trema orientale]|uniref:Uncharacterized protein n=1 Tax=Trema orientale TaxID=63057 RepID=A0A2P5FDV5_TREOI|nr:hypothetical protein TorRG33x02_081940 [Trema orientale]
MKFCSIGNQLLCFDAAVQFTKKLHDRSQLVQRYDIDKIVSSQAVILLDRKWGK